MTLKYAPIWQIILYVVLALAKGLQVVFVAYIFQQFINFAQAPTGSLGLLTLGALGGLLVFGGLSIVYQFITTKIVATINLRLKSQAATALLQTRPEQNNLDTSFLTNDLKQIETARIQAELKIIFNAGQFIEALIAALVSSWSLALIFLVAALAPATIQKLFGQAIAQRAAHWQIANRHYTRTVQDTVTGVGLAQLYQVGATFQKRFAQAAQKMETALQQTNWLQATATEVTTTGAYICSLIIPFAFGIYFVVHGQISLGTFMMITQLANNFINPIVNIFSALNDRHTTSPIWQQLQASLANRSTFPPAKLTPGPTFQQLELQDATVVLGEQTIFRGLNLRVKAGEKVLLKAPSGWGKSTLLQVLTGNYRLTAGKYLINGLDCTGNWEQAHQYCAVIQQEPFILDDTLRYNITLGRPLSLEQLTQAATQAGLSDLVATKGWNYQVGPHGQNLSGGQNQRLEIARALVAQRPLLLADEATSALDPHLAQQIHQIFLRDFPGTVIEVAHQISPADQRLFDRILDLTELGTPTA
ncbi:ABC transporter ATP-binding protein [Lactobacillus sp. DCY120]|uniref:ABC transporter ATP-binding protein n=1 Tax=Bombilactobacillus apium TaxID=2675299 RepID=A0A850R0U1_9LACO|nr:ABC transporter ATP-binding protein [Bombilactobacillus apium]NVY96533.1 ABC transporter ATP-binding protein [Bombilactobacillus apium]